MRRIKRLWQRGFAFISLLMKTAVALATILTIVTSLGLGSVILGYINHIISLITVGIVLLIIIALVIIYIFFYTLIEEAIKKQTNSTDTRAYPPPPPEEVEILRKEIVYVYFSDGITKRQRKRLQLRALQDHVTYFRDRYRWTGKGKCNIKSLTPSCKISNEYKEDGWEYFDVQFPHPLHKGEEIDFAIEWELVDEEKKAVDFLSTMIDRETKYLLLQVNLPPELESKRAYRYEYGNYIETLPIATQPTAWNPATQSITYEVAHPVKYHKYSIRWYSE